MAVSIVPGENLIHRFNLKKPDGSNLVLGTDLVSCTVQIIHKNNVIDTYTYPDANLREGAFNYQLELELPTALTSTLTKGDITARLTINAVDTEFEVDSGQVEIVDKVIATIK
jgi:hypothetical protein